MEGRGVESDVGDGRLKINLQFVLLGILQWAGPWNPFPSSANPCDSWVFIYSFALPPVL